jgi:hypothetical protein
LHETIQEDATLKKDPNSSMKIIPRPLVLVIDTTTFGKIVVKQKSTFVTKFCGDATNRGNEMLTTLINISKIEQLRVKNTNF